TIAKRTQSVEAEANKISLDDVIDGTRRTKNNSIAFVARNNIGEVRRSSTNEVAGRVDPYAISEISLGISAGHVRADKVALNNVVAVTFKPNGRIKTA